MHVCASVGSSGVVSGQRELLTTKTNINIYLQDIFKRAPSSEGYSITGNIIMQITL